MSPASRCTTIDVRNIPPPERHAAVFAAFRAIGLDDGLEIVNDHDPKPLYYQFQVETPGNFSWVYAQNGPEVWRVSIRKLARAHGAGECCGQCCSGR